LFDRDFFAGGAVENVDFLAGAVDEAQAVVVALLADVVDFGAVAFDDVQKRLDARVHAGVGRVGIQLQNQKRLYAHNPLQIMQHEGVGRAGEIGNVGNVNVVFVFQERAGLHVLLAVVPVHVGVDDLVGKRQNVKGDDRVAAGSVFPGDAHVGVGGKGVVGAAQNRDDGSFRPARLFERLTPQFGEFGKAFHLLFMGDGKGVFRFAFAEPQIRRHGDKRFCGFFQPVHEADDRRQVFFFRNLRKSFPDVVGQALRDGAEIGGRRFFIAVHVPKMRKKNIVHLPVVDVLHGAVRDFRRKAVAAFHAGRALRRDFPGQEGLYAHRVEKPGIKRPERVNGEAAWNADDHVFFAGKRGRIGGTFPK